MFLVFAAVDTTTLAHCDAVWGGNHSIWVHKIANVLKKFPKSGQPAVKADLREIWQAENAMDTFAEKYGAKYDKAAKLMEL